MYRNIFKWQGIADEVGEGWDACKLGFVKSKL
jgi:hypothetical protein